MFQRVILKKNEAEVLVAHKMSCNAPDGACNDQFFSLRCKGKTPKNGYLIKTPKAVKKYREWRPRIDLLQEKLNQLHGLVTLVETSSTYSSISIAPDSVSRLDIDFAGLCEEPFVLDSSGNL